MTSDQSWGRSLFKGRIGEAIVESVLSEFGYRVYRIGQENRTLSARNNARARRVFAPDLSVTDPKTQITKFVEVKFRSARPMSVILEASRLENIISHYPGTILAFVSSYNGSVNCANVDELSSGSYKTTPDGFCEFDLLRSGWRPLWHYFDLVQPGERLRQLWASLMSDLHGFAESRVSRTRENESFPGEREDLETYIVENWHTDMQLYTEGHSELKSLTLVQLWEEARRINAFLFALDVWGEENLGTYDFSHSIYKLLGQRGEQHVAIDLNELGDDLKEYPELLGQFESIRDEATAAHNSGERYAPSHAQTMYEFFQTLPEGVGTAYLLPEQGGLHDALEIDFRTFIALVQKRNRLDTDSG